MSKINPKTVRRLTSKANRTRKRAAALGVRRPQFRISMTNFIVTWSGLIFPLLGFLGMLAWRFPVSYNKLIGPIFMLFILAAFISTVAWNWGMARTERIITGLETSVAPETSWYDRPEAEYYRIDNEEEREKAKEEHEEKYFEWQKNVGIFGAKANKIKFEKPTATPFYHPYHSDHHPLNFSSVKNAELFHDLVGPE